MKVNTIQTITNIFDENNKLISTRTSSTTVLYPAEGKALKDITTNKIYTHSISISSVKKAKDFIEIDL